MAWTSYRGYMHCTKSPDNKHHMTVKGRGARRTLWMWCRDCQWAHAWPEQSPRP